ncbi:magnesium chelatase subunit D [Pseudotabrizicola alkalilacus]|uniref:Mg-protoporphyrin IX chelatase n=1 Tax=Pseudotabrizicola alkalilacus TaxID=2305252 RepID=A0A411Z1P8_9RHOB|nr:magnesium chelatase subunit D [Pseudotabrizicola alkalilacus]RGP36987.1 magnesium chelatase subunit D [Pseudotabrizicola alkalilacus]
MDWDRITLALQLLAIDPEGLKGLWLRARSGAVRDRVTAALTALPLPVVRLHPGLADDALYGGLDLPATLATGRPVTSRGLLSQPAALVLTMAERVPPGLSARLAHALDTRGHCLIALDEAAEEGEGLPLALTDRLGLFVDLDGIAWSDTAEISMDHKALAEARALFPAVTLPPDAASALTRAAAELGIASLRAPLLAMAAARALAAWARRTTVTDDDLRQAAELIYGHRALPLPEATPQDQPEPPPPDAGDDSPQDSADQSQPFPEDMLVEAARAALPADLLAQLTAGRAARTAKGASGTGAARSGNRRGRPLPSRPGRLGSAARIDLVATLRAAAPWQPLRRRAAQSAAVLLVRAADIRVKRFVETSDRVLIFAVDASGSSAFARLAEAKGAVELLLAAAYARRDHVALVSFRGTGAELILPPTRSLVQTKRRLAGLPGGGGTPLAAGMQLAMATAAQARARGLTPTIALLTDGRGNIALDGSANRAQAEADAQRLARAIRATGFPAVVIDTANRPQPSLSEMARQMDAPYLALPRADARRLSGVLSAALGE